MGLVEKYMSLVKLPMFGHKAKRDANDKAYEMSKVGYEEIPIGTTYLVDRPRKDKDKEIKDQDIREMLGLADRNKTILLFKEILSGDQKKAVSQLKELIDNGLDAKNFLNDIL